MKKLLILALVFVLSNGCLKNDDSCPYSHNNVKAPQSEIEMMQQYFADNDITTAVQHESNLFYEIIETGTGGSPDICNNIVIGYTGKLASGTVFEQVDQHVFVLGSLIEGWKKGIPMIKKGGKIRLYIPPSLAYGNNNVEDQYGNIVIPANSILIFDINLFDFY